MISWDNENDKPKYKKIIFEESNQEVELHEVLGTKKNIFNKPKEAMIDNFITNALHKYSEELECEPSQVFVLIYLELINEHEDVFKLHLYKGSVPIKEISLQQILPYLYTLLGDNSEYLEIVGARSITCYTTGGATNIVNSDGQDMDLPDGVAIELNADTGNTFTQVIITPAGGVTTFVSMLGGNATQF